MSKQSITPLRRIFHTGDTITFHLDGVDCSQGRAVVRTNLGRAEIRRAELIRHTRENHAILGLDWHDITMNPVGSRAAQITLPLTEIGVFEAKCCFIPDTPGPIEWPDGENFRIKVESAASFNGNTMYSAFVRQFGPNRTRAVSAPLPANFPELDQEGFTVIPPSGTFRALAKQLDHIFGTLGCRVLQLLPVHPTPTSFGRMGRYGSPFAATDYFCVDPALAEFDPQHTPMEQFIELIDAVHARDGRIFMDIPVNHTGWASKLQTEHPEYFVRKSDGTFESPGAWGVVWADLCKLNYRDPHVHELMADVFLFWCRRGIDGFRCDAGYMLPAEAWDYIVARVRQEYPDTVFLLEGLGGPLVLQEQLLGSAGLNWGYSELFQNYTRDEIAFYYPYMHSCSQSFGTLVNFAETHDNNRLAATSETYARLRFAVAALLSESGGFGFANGAEFFATEKIDVHGNGALNWGATPNLNAFIRTLTTLLADHPVFYPHAEVQLIQQGPGNVLAALRKNGVHQLLILLNLDCSASSEIHWPLSANGENGRDLLTGRTLHFNRNDQEYTQQLQPGEVLCVTFDGYSIPEANPNREPARIAKQRADAAARRLIARLGSLEAAGAWHEPGNEMLVSPEDFTRKVSGTPVPPLTHWREAFDPRRCVMIPPGDVLLVESTRRFRVEIRHASTTIAVALSLNAADGRRVAPVFLPSNDLAQERFLELVMTSFDDDGTVHRSTGTLVQLACGERRMIRLRNNRNQLGASDLHTFSANRCGGISFFPAIWGTINSKYDAILAGNANELYPVDRHTMFTRCRAWVTVNGYSQEIDEDSLLEFSAQPNNRARWLFHLPVGQGCRALLEVEFDGAIDTDAVRFRFRRRAADDRPGELEDATPIRLILRPDLEDRINHQLTKAFLGAEQRYPAAVTALTDGFDFAPAERKLSLRFPNGTFHSEPEWYYLVDLPAERYYGMEDKTDLFSPGYFDVELTGGSEAILTARITTGETTREPHWPKSEEWPEWVCPGVLFNSSMRRYIVNRDEFSTIIAGYPWFLDWGRDTLIVLRGLVAGEFRHEAAAIIRQFASFERNGTIPNMIRGRDDANRDTSDAPLYLIVAARDYIDAAKSDDLLNADCSGRPLREVLHSIVEHYIHGTPNGIQVDSQSGLVFSPSHFTWMDTNFPAGTPREGYPIEIQALWFAALEFLGREEPSYLSLAAQVRDSIESLYFHAESGCASDCLHCRRGTSAAQAIADDHIRPNQLLAVTLGAVSDPAKQRAILFGCEELLVPGGIRSLADRPTRYRLPVERDGHLLNNPAQPYQGHYRGSEDTSRKVAYHNGTVWSWPFPGYCEALFKVGGEAARERALSLLLSAAHYFETGVIGQMPEVADGDAPHRAGGCLAQAWSVSEFFRVNTLLNPAD